MLDLTEHGVIRFYRVLVGIFQSDQNGVADQALGLKIVHVGVGVRRFGQLFCVLQNFLVFNGENGLYATLRKSKTTRETLDKFTSSGRREIYLYFFGIQRIVVYAVEQQKNSLSVVFVFAEFVHHGVENVDDVYFDSVKRGKNGNFYSATPRIRFLYPFAIFGVGFS